MLAIKEMVDCGSENERQNRNTGKIAWEVEHFAKLILIIIRKIRLLLVIE